jgi:putative nucleotidyltransferase with HDIG domain
MSKAPPLPQTKRVLVVDDEPWITEVLCAELDLHGFLADATNDSTEVMEMLAAKSYDLAILDITMPDPDGLALLAQIQERYPYLAVLMLTALSDAETATQAMREGASDYVVKPYRTPQLLMRIERALERSGLLLEQHQIRQLLERRVSEQTRTIDEQSEQLGSMLDRVLSTYQATVKALEAALDVRDQSAPGHCRRVARLAVRLAARMGFSGQDLVTMEYGALLHDIGKLGIEDRILMKPGRLTDEEMDTMRRHPEIGCQIVGHIDFLRDALPIIRHHHEWYSGGGYPDGLAGSEIPLLARIFSVTDAFDAQTNQRPYNVVNSVEGALENLRKSKGVTCDPQVVDEFITMIQEQTPGD